MCAVGGYYNECVSNFNVLVGTCPSENINWILDKGLYNIPIINPLNEKFYTKISHLIVLNYDNVVVCCETEFISLEERTWLRNRGYPERNKTILLDTEQYAIFRIANLTNPKELISNPKNNIVVYTKSLEQPVILSDDFFSKEFCLSKSVSTDKIFAYLKPFFPRRNITQSYKQLCFSDFFMKEQDYKLKSPIRYSFVDLFAGCGGLSLGLEKAGFTPVLVNELNSDAMSTYLKNREVEYPWLLDNNVNNVKDLVLDNKLLEQYIKNIKEKLNIDIDKGELDLVCGGPPCQGFSGIGIRRSYSVEKAQLPSNYLFQDMAFLVNRLNPKIFLFENVRGLLTSRWTKNGEKGEIFKMVLDTFHQIGKYNICYKLVHAKDYGVPQNRPRILIVGLRKDVFPNMNQNNLDAVLSGFLPKPTGDAPNIEDLLGDLVDVKYSNGGATNFYVSSPKNDIQKSFRTTRDGKLMGKGSPLEEQEYSAHAPKIVEKFNAMLANDGEIPPEFKTKKFSQRVLPKKWDKVGPTITCCSAPDDYVHFSQPRSLTVREWARLQMFPDWYVFSGKRTTGGLRRAGNPREGIFDRELPKYTQIGNAVPVGLAHKIGLHFVNLLENINA